MSSLKNDVIVPVEPNVEDLEIRRRKGARPPMAPPPGFRPQSFKPKKIAFPKYNKNNDSTDVDQVRKDQILHSKRGVSGAIAPVGDVINTTVGRGMKIKPKKELKKANKSSNNQESLTAAAALGFMTQERQEMDHEAAILRSENAKLKKRLEDEMKKAEESDIIINDNDGVGDGSRDDNNISSLSSLSMQQRNALIQSARDHSTDTNNNLNMNRPLSLDIENSLSSSSSSSSFKQTRANLLKKHASLN